MIHEQHDSLRFELSYPLQPDYRRSRTFRLSNDKLSIGTKIHLPEYTLLFCLFWGIITEWVLYVIRHLIQFVSITKAE